MTTWSELALLPLLDKQTAIAHQEQLLTAPRPLRPGVTSSGTTRSSSTAPALEVAVDAAVGEFAEGASTEEAEGVVVVVVAVTHGLPGVPRPGEVYLPWMHDKNALLMLDRALRRRHRGRLPDTLRISSGALKAFVTWQIENDVDASGYGVRFVGTNSFRLSPHWRELIQHRLNCTIYDNYSLSEFATPATECKACRALHWGEPGVVQEVINLDTEEVVAARPGAVGELVLTTPHPLVQLMPLIRYRTGDVIELAKSCQATGKPGFHFRGRRRRGLVIDSRFVLAPTLVQDVLEAFADTERGAHPLVTLGVLKSRELGLPRFVVDDDGAVVRLRFETRYHPGIYRHTSAGLQDVVRAAVVAGDAGLRALLRQKKRRFVVEAVPPQTLTPPPDKYDP